MVLMTLGTLIKLISTKFNLFSLKNIPVYIMLWFFFLVLYISDAQNQLIFALNMKHSSRVSQVVDKTPMPVYQSQVIMLCFPEGTYK